MDKDFDVLNTPHAHACMGHIKYRLKGVIPADKLNDAISPSATTAEIIDRLAALNKKKTVEDNPAMNAARSKSRVRDIDAIHNILPKKIKTIADIGCGRGHILAGIGKSLGVGRGNLIGVDIPEWADQDLKVSEDITYVEMADPNKIPIKSASVDLVIIFMVLHHIEPDILKNTMSELRRILAPGGMVVIREHDAPPPMIPILNIEHALWQVVIEHASDAARFQETYFAKYRPRHEWVQLFKSHGFDPVFPNAATKPRTNTPLRPFMAAFT